MFVGIYARNETNFDKVVGLMVEHLEGYEEQKNWIIGSNIIS